MKELSDTRGRIGDESSLWIKNFREIAIISAREFIEPESGIVNRELENESQFPKPDFQFSEFHIPLLHKTPATLLDYLPPKALILIDDVSLVAAVVNEVEEQAVKLRRESLQEPDIG